MIVSSNTGTGKTITSVIAILSRVDVTKKQPQVLCITETDELAAQLNDMIARMGQFLFVTVKLLIRGEQCIHSLLIQNNEALGKHLHIQRFFLLDADVLGSEIKHQIIIGTPKEVAAIRILGGFDIGDVKLAVFDGIDKIANTDLIERHILKGLNAQVLFLDVVSKVACQRCLKGNSLIVALRPDEEILPNIVQFFMKTNVTQKYDVTLRIVVAASELGQVIIFCNVSTQFKNSFKYIYRINC